MIGHTGFVGSNLAHQHEFDDFYNSKNIEEIAGRSYDFLVCSGAPAEKWKANQDPEADLRGIDRLWSALRQVAVSKLVLISTVDVYSRPIDVDEDVDPGDDPATAYGRHRYELERRAADQFDTLVVRLPGLFGPGIKKNVVYDFLNGNGLDKIDARGVFQFYGLQSLWRDVETALGAGLTLVNFATEPTSVCQVAREAFGIAFTNAPAVDPPRYDFRTKHDRVFGGMGGYIRNQEQVLSELRAFVASQRGTRRCA